MASTSSAKVLSKKGRGPKPEPVIKLADVTCPICLEICIEPVTMPCKHELCLNCFEQHVHKASLRCPVCRCYISNWTRKAHREGTLVNLKRWKTIQRYFPEKVNRRLTSADDDSEEDDVMSPQLRPCVSEVGEIRKEFEIELQKIQDAEEKQRELENEKSERLIRMLTQMDARDAEKKRIQLLRLTEGDSGFARALSDELNTDPTAADLYVVGSEFNEHSSSPRPTSLPSLDAPLKSRKRGRPFLGTGFAAPAGSSHSTRAASQSVHHSDPEALLGSATPSSTTTPSIVFRRSSSSTSLPLCLEKFWVVDVSDTISEGEPCFVAVAGPSSRADGQDNQLCTESEDSISGELCHFRPIKVAPKTPPGRSPDGSLFEPSPVYTPRPRNPSNERNDRGDPPPPSITNMPTWLISATAKLSTVPATLATYSCSKATSFPLTPTNVSPKRLDNRKDRSGGTGVANVVTPADGRVVNSDDCPVVVDADNKENPVAKMAAFTKPEGTNKRKQKKSQIRLVKVQRVRKEQSPAAAPPTPPVTRHRASRKPNGDDVGVVASSSRSTGAPAASKQSASLLPAAVVVNQVVTGRTTRKVTTDTVATETVPGVTQEERDYQLAVKMQKEWRRETYYVDRRAGTDGQYHFRRRGVNRALRGN